MPTAEQIKQAIENINDQQSFIQNLFPDFFLKCNKTLTPKRPLRASDIFPDFFLKCNKTLTPKRPLRASDI